MEVDTLVRAMEYIHPKVPINRALWSATDIGKFLGVSAYTVSYRYANKPDFPEALRLPSKKGRGRLRWRAKEVMDWAERLRA